MLAVAIAYVERTATAHFVPFMLDTGDLTKQQTSLVLSAFGAGYIASLPFSGAIIGRLGHATTLRVITIGWLAAALAFPFASNFWLLAATRFALGAFEGPLFPLFVSWITLSTHRQRRPVTLAIVEACSYVGMAIAGPLSVYLAVAMGWQRGYMIVAAVGVLAVGASLHLKEPPVAAPASADATKRGENFSRSQRLPLALLFVALGFFLYNFAKSFYSTWFPTVLVKEFGLSSMHAASITSLQALLGPLASVLFSALSVLLLHKGASVGLARLMPMGIGFCLGAVIFLISHFPQLVDFICVVAFVGLIATSALVWSAVPDNADPLVVGTAAGWVNALANVGSLLSPLTIGWILESSAQGALGSVSLACLFAVPVFVLAYSLRASSEEQRGSKVPIG